MARSYWFFGHRLTVLADSDVTGGRYDLVEGQFPPGTQTPLHRHNRYLEQLYVLEGEFTVWAGAQMAVLHGGDTFTIPAGTAHAVAATGDGRARGLAIASPSGFARLIMAVGVPDAADAAPPPDSLDVVLFERISAEIGDEVLGPPPARAPPLDAQAGPGHAAIDTPATASQQVGAADRRRDGIGGREGCRS